MDEKWEFIEFDCPEEDRLASLLLEWRKENGKMALTGIYCDNPKFGDLNNWDCDWSCWKSLFDE